MQCHGGWAYLMVPNETDASLNGLVFVGLVEASRGTGLDDIHGNSFPSNHHVAYETYVNPPEQYMFPKIQPTLTGLYLLEHNIRVRLSRYHKKGSWFSCDPTTALSAIRTETLNYPTKIESVKIPSVFRSEYTRGSSPLSCITLKTEVLK